MSRIADARMPNAVTRWTAALAFCGAAVAGGAGDYPPPPGPYVSEPIEILSVTATPPDTAAPDTPPATPSRPGMLPLPPADESGTRGPHDATTLFGAAPPRPAGSGQGTQTPAATASGKPLLGDTMPPPPEDSPPAPARTFPAQGGGQYPAPAPGYPEFNPYTPGRYPGASPYPGPSRAPGRLPNVAEPPFAAPPQGYREASPPPRFIEREPSGPAAVRRPPQTIGHSGGLAPAASAPGPFATEPGPYAPKAPPVQRAPRPPSAAEPATEPPMDDAQFRPPGLTPAN